MKKGFPLLIALVALVGGYLYFKGGSVGSHDTSLPNVGPNDVANGVGGAVQGTKEAVGPWWQVLVSQPWFYAGVVGLALTAVAVKTWQKMPGFVRGVFIVVLTIAVVIIVAGLK
jgi:energy-converting hydrogenase Eha subunit B